MNNLIQIFIGSKPIFLSFVFIMSLLIGSFINVIIFRLPSILKKIWSQQCEEFLHKKDHVESEDNLRKTPFYKLFFRGSHCLHCNKNIAFYDNVPLISYLILCGKCRNCKHHISIQYPIIEALAAILATIVAMHFGVSIKTLAGCILTYVLLIQATIDFRHTFIPDEITLPMLWLGLLLSIPMIFITSGTAILGATLGYLSLWCLYWAFWFITKKEGMGYGDFKLLAQLGAWLGWQVLPFIILCSSVLGSVVGLWLIFTRGKNKIKRIPYGPFLAIAGWLALLYGHDINQWYWQIVGIY